MILIFIDIKAANITHTYEGTLNCDLEKPPESRRGGGGGENEESLTIPKTKYQIKKEKNEYIQEINNFRITTKYPNFKNCIFQLILLYIFIYIFYDEKVKKYIINELEKKKNLELKELKEKFTKYIEQIKNNIDSFVKEAYDNERAEIKKIESLAHKLPPAYRPIFEDSIKNFDYLHIYVLCVTIYEEDLKSKINSTIGILNTLFGETTSGTPGGYRKELKLRSIKKITKTKKKSKTKKNKNKNKKSNKKTRKSKQLKNNKKKSKNKKIN